MKRLDKKFTKLFIAVAFCIMSLFLEIQFAESNDKIDINIATRQELESLPGIGPKIAEEIIEYRKQHKGFKNIEELRRIRGIGKGRLSEIRLWATVSIPIENGVGFEEKKPISILNKLDINTASKRDLELLPGIGPSIAGNIIEYRVQNNGFKTIREMQHVKGIGESNFEKIKDFVTTTANQNDDTHNRNSSISNGLFR